MRNALIKQKASLSTIAMDGGTSDYTDAIDWGGTSVNTGQVNGDGDMVIEYYFEPGTGFYGGFLPRMDWTDYEKQQVDLAFDTFEAIIDVEFVETTNPADADEGTIRKAFAESIEANSVHGSDSDENAATEIAFFFSDDEIVG